jgi:hypothetical protein
MIPKYRVLCLQIHSSLALRAPEQRSQGSPTRRWSSCLKLTWLREDRIGVESKGRTKLHAEASELESERASLAGD